MNQNNAETQSLKNQFISQIENLILSGDLEVGKKLPSERQLAKQMNVSRGVVNGGLQELCKRGFVDIHPRSGNYVSDYRSKGTLETLNSIMSYNGGVLRKGEIRSILEVRIALDVLAIELCIDRLTDEQIDQMEAHIEEIKTASTVDEAVEGAYAFQLDLAMFSENVLIPLIFHSFKISVFALWDRFCELYGIETLYMNNFELFKRIKARDKKAAVDWVNSSIKESIDGKYVIYFE